jgi:integrase/recombinase XerD
MFLSRLEERNYSPKSLAVYLRALMDLEASLMRQRVEIVRNVNVNHLEAYRLELIERKLSPATIHLYLRTVRQFFGFLVEENAVFLNPAERLPNPPPPMRLPAVPTEAEINRILAHPRTSTPLGVRDRALLETAYGAALRLNELVCMTIDGLHLDEGTARVRGKGDRERVVPLGAESVRWLGRYLADVRPGLVQQATDRLWIGIQGAPLSYPGVVAIIRTHVRAAGLTIPVSPHSFRRACATHMLRRGASPLLIQQLLGHASLKHLGHYLRVSIRELKTTHATTRPGS